MGADGSHFSSVNATGNSPQHVVHLGDIFSRFIFQPGATPSAPSLTVPRPHKALILSMDAIKLGSSLRRSKRGISPRRCTAIGGVLLGNEATIISECATATASHPANASISIACLTSHPGTSGATCFPEDRDRSSDRSIHPAILSSSSANGP